MLRKPAPELRRGRILQRMGSDTYNPGTAAVLTNLASFHEEVDAARWPIQAARTFGELPRAADFFAENFNCGIKSAQVIAAV